MDTEHKHIKGGAFLLENSKGQATFLPELFTDEQHMVEQMCKDFLEKEVLPQMDAIDKLEPGLMASLLDKAGTLGLLGAAFPTELGGLGEHFVTATLITEVLGGANSFSVAVAAHNGIGSLPILYFGTEEQKNKYIPLLATGAYKGAYALTEPNAGSDALSAKTIATLSEDGLHYVLNGQKCWITNSGFADVFTVFAKVDGEKFTAFIVEKDTPGFTLGEEEKKMGIKGSSTRMLFFENAFVPVSNVLGEIGMGHIIAFNILNIGRLKLCAAALGAAKASTALSIHYAKTREQFGQTIANYGAIQHKLAEMYIKTFVTESALYRTAKWIETKEEQLQTSGKLANETLLGAAEEYAIECALLKVLGSETLDYVVDEGVQIHGGNGFSDEYPISRAYRDSRINRIFEGTNEINRLLILDMYLKRALKGRLDLLTPAKQIQNELLEIPSFEEWESVSDEMHDLVSRFKKAILMLAGTAVKKWMMKIDQEQEVLMALADMVIDTFALESALLRADQLEAMGHLHKNIAWQCVQTYAQTAADNIFVKGKTILPMMSDGDDLRLLMMGLKRFTKANPFNVIQSRRSIAAHMLNKEA